MQLGTRNILASPSTLGFDGLSILWLLIVHSLLTFFDVILPLEINVLIGVPVFVGIGLFFSRFIGRKSKLEKVILLGLTFNLMVGAVFSLWQFFFLAFNKPFPTELWFGHFRYSDLKALFFLLAMELCLILGLKVYRKEIQIFSLGSQAIRNWNINEKRLFRFIFISISLGTFLVVNLFGAFSFLGLVFPIVARRLWFNRYDLSGEFFMGAFLNGLFLMSIDTLCYFLPIYGAEVPVGLIVTGVGALSLILLLWISHKDSEFLANTGK